MEVDRKISALQFCTSRKHLKIGFRLTAICGLLIAIVSLSRQVLWHTEEPQVSTYWNFELEICFSIYGFFLASTSYYLGEIHANSWARFHIAVSFIGILLDTIILGYHANAYSTLTIFTNTDKKSSEIVSENHIFMITVAVCQVANNSVAILLCRQILKRIGVKVSERFQSNNGVEDSSTSLLRSPKPSYRESANQNGI